jgi:MoaA/NifB/PqqE/SkfB family radical SAM enzyme
MIPKKAKVALGIISRRARTGPIEVSLDLTRRCTLDCLMCWWRSPLLTKQAPAEWHREETDYTLVENVVKELKELDVKLVILGGQGDPMLYPRLFDAIELIKSKDMRVALITSGFYFTGKKIQQLFDLHIDHLDVSLQAATAETYQKLHPAQREDSFARIKEMIMMLTKLKKGHVRENPWIHLIFIICSYNYHECVRIIEFASEVGADSVGYKRVDVVPDTRELLLDESQLKEVDALLDRAEIRAGELSIGQGIRRFKKIIMPGLTTGKYTTGFYAQIPCYVGFNSARILETGDVIPCCGCYDLILGNVRQQSFRDIWFSKAYADFRRQSLCLDKKAVLDAGCKCYSCVDFNNNLGIYRKLHPVKAKELDL